MVKKGVARRKGGTNVLACKLRGPPVTQSRPGEARHISRGGVLSSLSSRNRLTVSVFYYYFKPFALFFPLASPPPPIQSPCYAPLVHQLHPPVVFLTTSAPRHPPTRSGSYALLSSLWLTSPLTPPYFDLSSALFHSRSRAFDYDRR